jgi:hypothetical protein
MLLPRKDFLWTVQNCRLSVMCLYSLDSMETVFGRLNCTVVEPCYRQTISKSFIGSEFSCITFLSLNEKKFFEDLVQSFFYSAFVWEINHYAILAFFSGIGRVRLKNS